MSQKGIIYLIQPLLLVGTNKYKLGCSYSPTLKRCITGYIKGSRYISIHECNDPLIVEKILIKKFNLLFKLAGGKENFEGDESHMSMIILETIIEYKKNNTINNTINNNTTNDTINNTIKNNTTNDTINKRRNKLKNNNLKNNNSNYKCEICKSNYASYQSLWNHKKIKHDKNTQISTNIKYNCTKYNKQFTNYQNKLMNQDICSSNNSIQKLESEIEILIQKIDNTSGITSNSTSKLSCKYCNKIFKYKQGKWKHEQKCKIKKQQDIAIKNTSDLEETIKKIIQLENNKITNITTDNNS